MKTTARHTPRNKPQCKSAAPPANARPPKLPPWQRERIRQLDWACRQVEARTSRGETIHSAARRIPTHPASLIHFLYPWRKDGAAALQQRFGQTLPAISEAEAIAFVNWALGRQGHSFAALFREFKSCGIRRAQRPNSTNSRRLAGWFLALRQRLAKLPIVPCGTNDGGRA